MRVHSSNVCPFCLYCEIVAVTLHIKVEIISWSNSWWNKTQSSEDRSLFAFNLPYLILLIVPPFTKICAAQAWCFDGKIRQADIFWLRKWLENIPCKELYNIMQVILQTLGKCSLCIPVWRAVFFLLINWYFRMHHRNLCSLTVVVRVYFFTLENSTCLHFISVLFIEQTDWL